ncbi:MAG: DUF2079 domain-containing protein [Planctomycetales bacterium]|jgi:uncharacterized membrane protein
MVVLGCVALAFALQSVLGSDVTATRFFSRQLWNSVAVLLVGQIQSNSVDLSTVCDVPFLVLLTVLLGASAVALVGFAATISFRRKSVQTASKASVVEQTCRVAISGWRWWLLPWLWEMTRILVFTAGLDTTLVMMTALYYYVMAVALAGWVTSLALPLLPSSEVSSKSGEVDVAGQKPGYAVPKLLLAAVVAYVVVFTAMNWQLFRGMLVPHGDTVMYEEHLWNVLQGKGFRSYLDQGLFLGEHIQVIHLALLPLYAIWSSHLLLEIFESLALALGAFPVFWMARRWSGSNRCAVCLAIAYLLYSPLQFLDIAIDLKTFRPICFGLAAMLFALDQLERGRIKSTVALFVVALLAKEDFGLILGPLGCWIAVQPFFKKPHDEASSDCTLPEFLTSTRQAAKYGIGLTVASVGYLLLTTRVLIPWFRDGVEVHYARYFAKFGDSLGEIVVNMLTQPGLLIEELVTVSSISYLLALLLPLAFLPLLSPVRFAVAVPILGLLCLNEIVKGDPQPHHHFHAPVVPVLFWATAHSLSKFRAESSRRLRNLSARFLSRDRLFVPALVLALCCAVGAVVGMSPLSIKFWDSGSFFHWGKLYVPSERAEKFAAVLEQIPYEARVASTDFVHPRFTHHERSYDYSHYLRKVAGYEVQVPDDTDFIVIDTQHYYSDIKSPDQVRELQDEPEKWELLEDRTDGYFIILKRRR